MRETKYLLDTNVFITAKNTCYSFSICPGFWEALIQFHNQNRIDSINQVRKEIMKGKKTENLVVWVKNSLPKQFFKSIDQEDVQNIFRRIIRVLGNSWKSKEINEFTKGADSWLVAYAQVHRYILVTLEVNKPKHKIQIPEVCQLFDVPCIDLYQMLTDLNVRFIL